MSTRMLLTALAAPAGQDPAVVAVSASFAVLALSAGFVWWQLLPRLRYMRKARDEAAKARAMREALPDLVRLLGSDHPTTLAHRIYLAHSQADADWDADAAAAAFEELLADCLRILGPNHPDTRMVRSELAYWQREAGDIAAAARTLDEPHR